MKRSRNLLTILLTVVLAALAIAQGPSGPVVVISFDQGVAPDSPREGIAVTGDAKLRVVAQEGGRGAVFEGAGGLTYEIGDRLGPSGAVTFGVQPLRPLDDSTNHRYFMTGPDGAAGTLAIWKTGLHNDLRLRAYLADGKYVEVVYPRAERWRPAVWHFLSASWGPGSLRLAIDGSNAGAATLPRGFTPKVDRVTIGTGPAKPESAQAVLDDVALYAAARPPKATSRDYERFLSGERPNLDIPYVRPPRPLALDLLPPADATFAVVSDLHIPSQGAHGRFQHEERVEELVRQLNALDVDFVLDAGDINTSFPKRPDFEACNANALRILKELRPPIYHAPGNHDVGNKHQFESEPFDGWFVSPENIATYEAAFGPDHFTVDSGDLHCVMLNNQICNSLPDRDQAQWEWLVDDLQKNRGKKIFLVMHNPLFWVSLNDSGTNNYETVNEPRRSDFVKLCREYGVRAVFTGHTHHAITNLVDGTWLLTLPSTTFARNFGDNYGLSGMAVVWDPARVGFIIARVRGDKITYRTVRTYAPLPAARRLVEGRPAPTTRLVGAASGDLAAPPIGLMAPPPPGVSRGPWSAQYVIDGVARPDDPGTIDRHAWTSTAHQDEDQQEYLEVRLAEPVPAERLELWARPGGSGFPTKATVSVRAAAAAEWVEVGRWEVLPEVVKTGPLSFALPGSPVAGVRIEIAGMMPMFQGRRASITEVVLRDANGQDRALQTAGASVTARSSAGGNKQTLDDNLWQAARDVGARETFLDAAHLQWAAAGDTIDPALARAVNMGRVADTRLWLPVTLAPPAGVGDPRAALSGYARRLATAGPGVGGLVVWPAQGDDVATVTAAMTTVKRAAGKLPVGLRVGSLAEAEKLAALLPKAALVLIDDGPDGKLARMRELVGEKPLWVVLPALKDGDATARARSLASRATALLAMGCRVVAPAAGTPGGVLNETATPTPCGHVVAAMNTLLDGGTPERATAAGRSFRRPDGGTVVVAVEPVSNGAAVSLGGGAIYVVDPLRGTLAKLAEKGPLTVNLSDEAAPTMLVTLPPT